MKYFKLEFCLEKSIVGDFPQIQQFKKGYDPNRRESCSQVGRYFFGKKPDVEIDFDGLQLSNNAKLTDYVSSSYLNSLTGLLVSERLFDFLMTLNSVEFVSFPTKIYQKEQIVSNSYKWLHFVEVYPGMINFPKSHFFLDHSEAKYKEVKVDSFEMYSVMQNQTSYDINSKRIVLNPNTVSHLDVLRLGTISCDTYVTESVKELLIENKFTGLVYEPAENLILG